MRGRNAIILGLINVCLMTVVFFYGFSAGKEHENYLKSVEQVNAQIRYPIERVNTARLEDLSQYRSPKNHLAK